MGLPRAVNSKRGFLGPRPTAKKLFGNDSWVDQNAHNSSKITKFGQGLQSGKDVVLGNDGDEDAKLVAEHYGVRQVRSNFMISWMAQSAESTLCVPFCFKVLVGHVGMKLPLLGTWHESS